MKITLPLIESVIDDERIPDEIISEFRDQCQIYVYKDTHDFSITDCEEAHAFGIWIQYGKLTAGNGFRNELMFDVNLDELEIFAAALMKSIEMLRRDYADVIKTRIENDYTL